MRKKQIKVQKLSKYESSSSALFSQPHLLHCHTLAISFMASWRAWRDLRHAKNKYSHRTAMHLTYHIVISKRKMSRFLWLIVDSTLQGPDHHQILCPFFDTGNPNVPLYPQCTLGHTNPVDFPLTRGMNECRGL